MRYVFSVSAYHHPLLSSCHPIVYRPKVGDSGTLGFVTVPSPFVRATTVCPFVFVTSISHYSHSLNTKYYAVLLYRNKESSLFLTNISQESRQHLQYVSKITIAEIQGDDVMREYVAPVHLIKDMRDILN